ncbi:MAG: DNA translocase FtsK [Eubacterium sp.]|jgi:S-DNA-T family DNA segregation ATPase FtsK/SpoIIIE|nr:DNA translocase FtsK [Eubacterium sp.]NBI87129.1 DNA translocase FtsK [Lachnospiraceae bacterium]
MAAARKSTRKQGRAKRGAGRKKASKAQGLAFEGEVVLWILLAVSILLFVSNFGIGGAVGGFASKLIFGLFGLMAYVFPIVLFVGSCFLISNKKNHFAIFKFVAGFLLFCAFCMFLQLIVQDKGRVSAQVLKTAYTYSATYKKGGGLLGGLLVWLCVPNFGAFGSFVISVAAMIISMVLLTERSLFRGMKRGGQKVYETAREDVRRYHDNQQRREQERGARRVDKKAKGVSFNTLIKESPSGKKKRNKKPDGDEVCEILPEDIGDLPGVQKTEHIPVSPVGEEGLPEIFMGDVLGDGRDVKTESAVHETPPQMINGKYEYEDAKLLEGMLSDVGQMAGITDTAQQGQVASKASVLKPQKPKAEGTADAGACLAGTADDAVPAKKPQPYVFPPVSLLKQGSSKAIGDSKTHLRATANKLQQTLKNFGVNVTILNISSGPSVTRYEIQPEMGVKVSKIVNLTDDIKLNLAAADIRMEAPIPGKAAIGIEIPNKENVTVMFRELIESAEFQTNQSNIAFAAGKDIAGQVIVTDIAKMPHLLIAGATGSGKSVCINTIIMSILYKAHPDDVKLIMVDPKVVELSVYNGIPHLMIPVVTDPKKAAGALNWAVAEMEDRYQKFAECGVRDLKGYNAKVESISSIEGDVSPQRLPQIVIIVDELADLMMVASHEVETSICRLAQLARAAGLHLIIATQRPSVNVITGLIKANMPSRVAFAVTSGVDSRTILDMVGAEKLLGKGDMLFFPQNFQKPLRVQGAFVSDDEVSAVVDFIKKENGVGEYNPKIQESVEQSENISMSISDGSNAGDSRDVLFYEAGRFLIESEKGSIGSIQRRFKVGFNRAARIMDQLAEAGLVGPEEGTKARKILMTAEEFEQLEK